MILDIEKVHNVIHSNPMLSEIYIWYLEHCMSLNAPYHNYEHTLGMMYHIIKIYEQCHIRNDYGFTLSQEDLTILLISALFHDFNHSCGTKPDSINVETAKQCLEYCIKSLYEESDDLKQLIYACQETISATEYPYIINDNDLNIHQRILRECDILVVLYDNFITHNIMGLYEEMRTEKNLTMFVVNYLKFILESMQDMKLVYSIELWNDNNEQFLSSFDVFSKILLRK